MREKARERCSEQIQGWSPMARSWLKSPPPGFKRFSCLSLLSIGITGQTNFYETLQMSDGFGRIFHRISQNFTKCCKDSGLLMVIKCRKENSALKECLTAYYTDPAFYEECKMEYLKEREEFRRTGIPAKKRLQKLPTSM
ncbi:COX assembly mitochondrial protein homolog isoform X2 [Saimiri boliviensis]